MLLNQDAAENLNNLEHIRLVHLRLRRSGLDLLRQADDNLPDALEATSEQVEAPVIEITLRGEPHSRQPLGRRALDLVRDLVGDPNIREGVDQLNVRGRDRRTGTVQPST